MSTTTTITPNRRMRRRIAAGAAVVFGASLLGACDFTLGNGDEPNCSPERVEQLQGELSDAQGDAEDAETELEYNIAQARIRAAEIALDACDGDQIYNGTS